jgi:hypothetical protein
MQPGAQVGIRRRGPGQGAGSVTRLAFCVDPARLAETAFCVRRSWIARWRNLALRLVVESLALDADQGLLIERLINNLTLDECGQVISLAEVEILARSCQSG